MSIANFYNSASGSGYRPKTDVNFLFKKLWIPYSCALTGTSTCVLHGIVKEEPHGLKNSFQPAITRRTNNLQISCFMNKLLLSFLHINILHCRPTCVTISYSSFRTYNIIFFSVKVSYNLHQGIINLRIGIPLHEDKTHKMRPTLWYIRNNNNLLIPYHSAGYRYRGTSWHTYFHRQ